MQPLLHTLNLRHAASGTRVHRSGRLRPVLARTCGLRLGDRRLWSTFDAVGGTGVMLCHYPTLLRQPTCTTQYTARSTAVPTTFRILVRCLHVSSPFLSRKPSEMRKRAPAVGAELTNALGGFECIEKRTPYIGRIGLPKSFAHTESVTTAQGPSGPSTRCPTGNIQVKWRRPQGRTSWRARPQVRIGSHHRWEGLFCDALECQRLVHLESFPPDETDQAGKNCVARSAGYGFTRHVLLVQVLSQGSFC